MNRGILLGSDDGFLRIYVGGSQKPAMEKKAHEKQITDIQYNSDKTLFITAGKDAKAKVRFDRAPRATPALCYPSPALCLCRVSQQWKQRSSNGLWP